MAADDHTAQFNGQRMTSGNRLFEVDRWLVEVECQRLEVGCCLVEGGW